jgi:hypothetical protein
MLKKVMLAITIISLLLIPLFSSTACAEFGKSVKTWYSQKVVPVAEDAVLEGSSPIYAWNTFRKGAPSTAAFIQSKILSDPGYLINLAKFSLGNALARKVLGAKIDFTYTKEFAKSHLVYLDEWGPNAWKAYTAFWVYIEAETAYKDAPGSEDDDEKALRDAASVKLIAAGKKAFGDDQFYSIPDQFRWLSIRIYDAVKAGMDKNTAMKQWKKLFAAMAGVKNWEEMAKNLKK